VASRVTATVHRERVGDAFGSDRDENKSSESEAPTSSRKRTRARVLSRACPFVGRESAARSNFMRAIDRSDPHFSSRGK